MNLNFNLIILKKLKKIFMKKEMKNIFLYFKIFKKKF